MMKSSWLGKKKITKYVRGYLLKFEDIRYKQLPISIEVFHFLNFKRAKDKGPYHNTFLNYHTAHYNNGSDNEMCSYLTSYFM